MALGISGAGKDEERAVTASGQLMNLFTSYN